MMEKVKSIGQIPDYLTGLMLRKESAALNMLKQRTFKNNSYIYFHILG